MASSQRPIQPVETGSDGDAVPPDVHRAEVTVVRLRITHTPNDRQLLVVPLLRKPFQGRELSPSWPSRGSASPGA